MNKSVTDDLVTERDIEAYERDGAVCLRGVFDADWLVTLAVGLEKNFADPGPDKTVYTGEGEPGGFYDDYCNWQRIPEFQRFLSESNAAQLAAQVMRSRSANDSTRIRRSWTRIRATGRLPSHMA